jgi:hypothetical protein
MRGVPVSRVSSFRRFSLVIVPAFVAAIQWALVLAVPALAQESASSSLAARPLITKPLEESSRTTLKGNTHPLARPDFDLGPAPATQPVDRMLLVLKRSSGQEVALRKLLDDQQDKASPNYHKWLTPQQFGALFGPTDADMQTITQWLQSHGFQVGSTKGRTVLEFSGSASQVQEAFHTTIHGYMVNGQQFWANSSDPQIPTALTPAVAGIFTLHNFYKRPQIHRLDREFSAKAVRGARPQFTASDGSHALGPSDYYTIYNFHPLGNEAGSIAIVGRSNINLQDVTYFHYWMYDQAESAEVVLNGPDPGDLGGDEEAEAVLDTTWAGAVAPGAFLRLVVSQSTATTDGTDLSEVYIIDNNLADVMSESFGDCEANFTSTEAAGVGSLAEQAAAQGITYLVAAGDSGSAGCDSPNTETKATHGLGVNLLASTPYTVAVGGTLFNENGHDSAYWSSTNAQATQESALSYIPENAWNESCLSSQSGCSTPGLWAGGGGASAIFTKPSWQTGATGIPSDNARDLPDVSLTAAGHDPYLICLRGSCIPDANGEISFAGVSGTSASTPSFAGIMALIGSRTGVRLGQPNYVLYRLAAAENLSQCNASVTPLPAHTCVFNDVTVGNNAVPGETSYGTTNPTYPTKKGYDLATGLGSVDVNNLITKWSTVTFSPTTTSFSMSPTSAVHGSPLNVTGTVAPSSGTSTPTGTVWLVQSGYPHGNLVGDSSTDFFKLDSNGSYSGVTHLLPGGTYDVSAYYPGDGTYGGSASSQSVQVTIQPESTTTTFSVLTPGSAGSLVPFSSESFGTPVYLLAHVSWPSGYGVPSSYVTFWDNGGSVAQAWPDAKGNVAAPPLTQLGAGTHSITAGYYGDNNFSSSVDLTPINFTITSISTKTRLTSKQTSQQFLLTATVSASGKGSPATGTVTFSSGGTVLGAVSLDSGTTSNGVSQATATFDARQMQPGQYNVIATYPGDGNYAASSSASVPLNLVAAFGIANQGIGSQTVAAGSTASYVNDIVVTSFFGFASTVKVSCSVPAQGATCWLTPTSYSLTNGIGIGSLSVGTTARGTAVGMMTNPSPSSRPIWHGSMVIAFAFTMLVPVPRRRRLKRMSALALLLLVSIVLGMLGCGGSGSGSGGGGGSPPQTGTPAGTYTVTVTGTSGTLTQTTTLALVVQ